MTGAACMPGKSVDSVDEVLVCPSCRRISNGLENPYNDSGLCHDTHFQRLGIEIDTNTRQEGQA